MAMKPKPMGGKMPELAIAVGVGGKKPGGGRPGHKPPHHRGGAPGGAPGGGMEAAGAAKDALGMGANPDGGGQSHAPITCPTCGDQLHVKLHAPAAVQNRGGDPDEGGDDGDEGGYQE
jgi:hypothetical protein